MIRPGLVSFVYFNCFFFSTILCNPALPLQPTEELPDFRNVFNVFDKNGDGKISMEEMGDVMGLIGGSSSEKDLKDMMHEMDANGNGTIDYPEFVALILKKQSQNEDNGEIQNGGLLV